MLYSKCVKRAEYVFSILQLPVDFLMLLLAGIFTYVFRTRILDAFRPVLFEFNLPLQDYIIFTVGISFIFLGCYAIAGLYNLRTTRSALEEISKIFLASSAGILAVIIYIFLRQELFNSRFLVLGAWLFSILFVALGRALMKLLQNKMVARYNYGIHKVMLIGNDEITEKIKAEMSRRPNLGYKIVKHLIDPEIQEVRLAVGNPGIDEVILATPNYPANKILELVDFCNEWHINFRYVPNLFQTLTANVAFDTLAGVPIVELKRTALDGWGKVIKGIIDFIGAGLGLLLISPLFGIAALVIKWETDGPVFVRLKRVSGNREFELLKFRSMVKNAEELKKYLFEFNERKGSPLFKMKKDPRVTKVGRFIRRYRIDELPQLINVLKGEMSLVGPRPHQPDEVVQYQKHHKKVLAIKAGATGLAQVSGSSDLDFEKEVALDTFYIENWSLWLDIKILLKTALKIFFDKSAV